MDKLTNKISDLSSVPVYADKFNTLVDEVTDVNPSAGTMKANTISEYTSGSGVTVDSVLLKDGMVSMATQTLAATGDAQSNAGAITGQVVFVTGADNTRGVILPAVSANKIVIVLNQANAVLKIYPATGEKINGGTANTAISVAAYSFTILGYKAAGDWNAAENSAAA
jgi:hypothetical protein